MDIRLAVKADSYTDLNWLGRAFRLGVVRGGCETNLVNTMAIVLVHMTWKRYMKIHELCLFWRPSSCAALSIQFECVIDASHLIGSDVALLSEARRPWAEHTYGKKKHWLLVYQLQRLCCCFCPQLKVSQALLWGSYCSFLWRSRLGYLSSWARGV